MKRRKFTILTAVLTLAILSGIFIYENENQQASYSKKYLAPRVLYWGTQGEDVKKVQSRLVQWGYLVGQVDGIYGPETYRAVRRFQE
ncbi:MAG: peptidoglycan-binding protein, partial [Tissierellales bacterium]